MTVFLLLVATAVMIAICCYRERRCKRLRDWAKATLYRVQDETSAEPPADLLYHPGHTWVRVHTNDLVTVGTTSLAVNLVGDLATVELPLEHTKTHQGQSAWTLSSNKGRRLTQAMPIDGKVLAVNDELLRDPGLVQRSPYDSGWILLVKPRNVQRCLTSLLPATAAEAWVDSVGVRLNSQFEADLGVRPYDGDTWLTCFGDQASDDVWDDMRHAVLSDVACAQQE
jgi:glycine cleavage system H protein